MSVEQQWNRFRQRPGFTRRITAAIGQESARIDPPTTQAPSPEQPTYGENAAATGTDRDTHKRGRRGLRKIGVLAKKFHRHQDKADLAHDRAEQARTGVWAVGKLHAEDTTLVAGDTVSGADAAGLAAAARAEADTASRRGALEHLVGIGTYFRRIKWPVLGFDFFALFWLFLLVMNASLQLSVILQNPVAQSFKFLTAAGFAAVVSITLAAATSITGNLFWVLRTRVREITSGPETKNNRAGRRWLWTKLVVSWIVLLAISIAIGVSVKQRLDHEMDSAGLGSDISALTFAMMLIMSVAPSLIAVGHGLMASPIMQRVGLLSKVAEQSRKRTDKFERQARRHEQRADRHHRAAGIVRERTRSAVTQALLPALQLVMLERAASGVRGEVSSALTFPVAGSQQVGTDVDASILQHAMDEVLGTMERRRSGRPNAQPVSAPAGGTGIDSGDGLLADAEAPAPSDGHPVDEATAAATTEATAGAGHDSTVVTEAVEVDPEPEDVESAASTGSSNVTPFDSHRHDRTGTDPV